MASEQVVVEVNEANELVSVNVITSSSGGTVTSVAISGTDGIQVDSGSPIITSGTIVLGLSPTVLSQLSLASSALQPGDNISELVNDSGFLEGIQAGANISIDSTDPLNPIISATGMGAGTVTSIAISGTDGIEVDSGSPITSSGTIQLGLSSTVLNQLSLASSSLQISQDLADLSSAPDALINLGLTATATELNYTDGVTSPIQAQLDGKVTSGTNANLSGILLAGPSPFERQIQNPLDTSNHTSTFPDKSGYFPMVADSGGAINLADLSEVMGLLADANISSAAAWNAKQDAITGGATSIVSSNLTASRALVSDGSGKVAVSSVTGAELGYLSGVTSSIQTQLGGKIGGSTGATNNALLLADGTGGVTLKSANGVTQSSPHYIDFRAATGVSEYMGFIFYRDGADVGAVESAFGNMTLRTANAFLVQANGLYRFGVGTGGNVGIGSTVYNNSPVALGVEGSIHSYNSYSSSTNFEALSERFVSNIGRFGTVAGSGGGTLRNWELAVGDGVAASVQAVSTGAVITGRLQTQRNYQTGTTYTLQLSDVGKSVILTNASDIVVTIPDQSTVTWPTDCEFTIIRGGAGKISAEGESVTTINGSASVDAVDTIGAAILLMRTASNTFLATGVAP